MPDFNPDTLQTARNAGYTDDQIYAHLSQTDPRFDTARQAGYKLDDVAVHLSAQKAPSLPTQEIQPRMGLSDMLFDPETAQNLRAGIQDVVSSIPGMAAQIPKMAYQGLKFAVGSPQQQAEVGTQALTEAVMQGQQMAKDVQSPLGSRESFRGLANLGLMAAPAVGELLGEAALAGETKPPIQTRPQIPEGQISDVVQPQPKVGEINAQQIQEPARPDGNVQLPVGEAAREVDGGQVSTAVSSEGVQTGGQGETLQQTPQEVAPSVPQPEQPTGARPVSKAIDLSDPSIPITERGPTLALKLDDGTVVYDSSARLHSQVLDKAGVEPTKVVDSGIYKPISKEFVSKTPDTVEIFPKNETGSKPVAETHPLQGQTLYRGSNTNRVSGEDRFYSAHKETAEEYAAGGPGGVEGKVEEVKGETLPSKLYRAENKEELADKLGIKGDLYGTAFDNAVKEKIQAHGYEGVVYEAGTALGDLSSGGEQEVHVFSKKPTLAPEAEGATTAQPLPQETAPLAQEEVPTQGQAEPVSTKNAYTETQRAERGLPEVEQAAKRDFGTVWDEAAAQSEKDPSIGRRLVDELNNKPREVSDTENAHLLRTQIAAQTEHSAAVDAVNSAKTPEDLTAAKSRLELARNDLQNVYDATKRAGTKSGQALASRQMLAKEDYTLASMEARRRAANNGVPLNESQLSETKALHEKIADLQSKLDAHEVAQKFNEEFSRLVNEAKKDAKASKSTTKFNDFMDRKADEARARIVERRGRLTTGFDPSAIADEAIIGASHIAKGITKFADWSVKMADEFGDAVRPFLKEIWEKAKAFHAETGKEYGEKALARYKTYLGKQTEQIKGKIEAGDFTKAERQRTKLDAEAFTMRANLQRLKNQFEKGVAKEAYQNKSPAQKFWDHFVGVERAMKLSGPEVFGKLGVAAFTREALAPVESAAGYATSKLFPRLAAGTKYGADLPTVIRAELKAKAAMFTKGMVDAAQNVKGKETELDAISGTKIRPDFWYNRIGQMHAAIKAPVKRAEFTRVLEQRMDAALKAGEDIHHPEVMTRLANESVMDANRAIFQQKTVVSSFFSMLDRQVPVAGRTARFLFPVVKIPVNLFKELVTYHTGAPVAATKIGMAYWKGVETLPPIQREAIIRQFTKGSVGGAALLWGYFNSDKVRKFFDNAPQWFSHTPMAMVLNEGSYLKKLHGTDPEKKEGVKELAYMAKTDIPFMYSVKNVTDALDTHNSSALQGWINNMVQSSTVPQLLTQTAKTLDKPGSFPSNLSQKPTYRVANNPIEAVKLAVPGFRQQVPEKQHKTSKNRPR